MGKGSKGKSKSKSRVGTAPTASADGSRGLENPAYEGAPRSVVQNPAYDGDTAAPGEAWYEAPRLWISSSSKRPKGEGSDEREEGRGWRGESESEERQALCA